MIQHFTSLLGPEADYSYIVAISPVDRRVASLGIKLIFLSFLIPEIRDHDGKSRMLEVLSGGKKVLDELNK